VENQYEVTMANKEEFKINKLCLTCKKRCKQSSLVVLVKCKSYDPVVPKVDKPKKK
jgi:hypothetical protein